MSKIDLRAYKKEIRSEMRRLRSEMPPEVIQRKDEAIYRKVLSLNQYFRARTVILYVSKELEVDTWRLMRRAFRDGKQVAVPRCIANTRQMQMHLIQSTEELSAGAFGILEPPEDAPVLQGGKDDLCIVPAFCNDYQGYRVGYGGGYYDRYLSTFPGVKVGINYSECVRPKLVGGRYDVPIDLLVTDRYIRRCRLTDKNARFCPRAGKEVPSGPQMNHNSGPQPHHSSGSQPHHSSGSQPHHRRDRKR